MTVEKRDRRVAETITPDRRARLLASGWTEAELRLIRLSDIAEGYEPPRETPAAAGPGRSKRVPLTDEQVQTARSMLSADMSESHVARVMRIDLARLRRYVTRVGASS